MASSKDSGLKGKALVDAKIGNKQLKVVMFSKSYCPFCTKAKKALKNYDLKADEYEVIEIESRDDCNEIQDYLKKLTGSRSVPRVYINGKCIGGGDETAQLHSSGKLKALLA